MLRALHARHSHHGAPATTTTSLCHHLFGTGPGIYLARSLDASLHSFALPGPGLAPDMAAALGTAHPRIVAVVEVLQRSWEEPLKDVCVVADESAVALRMLLVCA